MNQTSLARNAAPAGRPEASKNAALWGALGTATFMASLDNLVVTMALPHIQREFSTSIQGLTWTVNAYTLPFAILMLAAAMAGDRWGRRRVFSAGVLLFGFGSAVAASAPSYEIFVAARAVQGVGGALVVPLSLTLLISAVPVGRRALVIAVLSGIQGLGIALGPFIGGLIISFTEWQWVFWINVPITAVVLALSLLIPSSQLHRTDRLPLLSLGLLSLGLLGAAATALTFSDRSWWTLVWMGLTVVCLGVGLRHVLRQDHAALPAALLRTSGFIRSNATALLVTAGIFGIVFILTQYLQVAMGYTPLQAGVATLPWTLLPAVSAPVAGMAVSRLGMRPLITMSTILQILGLGWFLMVIHPDASYLSLLPGMIMAGLGMGVFFALITGQAIAFATRATEGGCHGDQHVRARSRRPDRRCLCGGDLRVGWGVCERRRIRLGPTGSPRRLNRVFVHRSGQQPPDSPRTTGTTGRRTGGTVVVMRLHHS